jgi:hypothetical protein
MRPYDISKLPFKAIAYEDVAYSPESWKGRKCTCLFKAALLGPGKILYHSARLSLDLVSIAFRSERSFILRRDSFTLARDFQEILGNILTLFSDRVGSSRVEDAQRHKSFYAEGYLKDVEDSKDKRFQEFFTTAIDGDWTDVTTVKGLSESFCDLCPPSPTDHEAYDLPASLISLRHCGHEVDPSLLVSRTLIAGIDDLASSAGAGAGVQAPVPVPRAKKVEDVRKAEKMLREVIAKIPEGDLKKIKKATLVPALAEAYQLHKIIEKARKDKKLSTKDIFDLIVRLTKSAVNLVQFTEFVSNLTNADEVIQVLDKVMPGMSLALKLMKLGKRGLNTDDIFKKIRDLKEQLEQTKRLLDDKLKKKLIAEKSGQPGTYDEVIELITIRRMALKAELHDLQFSFAQAILKNCTSVLGVTQGLLFVASVPAGGIIALTVAVGQAAGLAATLFAVGLMGYALIRYPKNRNYKVLEGLEKARELKVQLFNKLCFKPENEAQKLQRKLRKKNIRVAKERAQSEQAEIKLKMKSEGFKALWTNLVADIHRIRHPAATSLLASHSAPGMIESLLAEAGIDYMAAKSSEDVARQLLYLEV